MKKSFAWILIPVFLALIFMGIVLGKNWEKIVKTFKNKTTADVSKSATTSSLISSTSTITPVPKWNVYTGETIYTTDGSSQFSIEHPPDWVPTKNVLYCIGQNPDGTTANLTLGAGGHGIDPSLQPDVSKKTYPAGEFNISDSVKGQFIIASMMKDNISYIFEFRNIMPEKFPEYKTMLDQMLVTLKLTPNPFKTFSSQNLKISFHYPISGINVVEKGDKVFVKDASSPDPVEDGQWVQVFNKDVNETVPAVIKRLFLSGISDKDCFVIDNTKNYHQYNIVESFSFWEISYPMTNPPKDGPPWESDNKCPKDYSQTNGMRYFLSDKNHPDRFLFFNIGQYAIPASDSSSSNKIETWQDTIEFL